jgi:hypothetical protein
MEFRTLGVGAMLCYYNYYYHYFCVLEGIVVVFSWDPNDILLVSSSTYHNNMQLFWFLHVFYIFMYPILHVGLNWFLNLGLPSLQNLFVVVMEQTHTMGSSSSSNTY